MNMQLYSFALYHVRTDIRNCSRSDRDLEGFAAERRSQMRWRREIDYHGSRSYDEDRPDVGALSAFMAWLSRFGGHKEPKPVVLQEACRGLPPGTRRGFSMLGETSPAPRHDPVDCPFPIKSDASYAHDGRVLP
jgi:hypothetical protein